MTELLAPLFANYSIAENLRSALADQKRNPVVMEQSNDVQASGPLLLGNVNYLSWKRQFIKKAKVAGLWKLFNGIEKVQKEPDTRPQPPTIEELILPLPGTESGTDQPITVNQENFAKYAGYLLNAYLNRSLRIQEYDFKKSQYDTQWAAYEDNARKVAQAIEMLDNHLSEFIRIQIYACHKDPGAAWRFLEDKYKPSEGAVTKQLMNTMRSLRYSEQKGVPDLIDQVSKSRLIYLEYSKDGWQDNDAWIIDQVLAALPKQYQTLGEMYKDAHDEAHRDWETFAERLMAKEQKLKYRGRIH